MTQATYYLTSHPGSPERRKALYGEPKPREWLRVENQVNDVDRKILKKLNQPEDIFSWKTAKIRWNKTGITYNGMNAAMSASGISNVTIMYHCRRVDGNFKVIGRDIEMIHGCSKYSVLDTETGKIYKSGREATRALGIRYKSVYHNIRFTRLEE